MKKTLIIFLAKIFILIIVLLIYILIILSKLLGIVIYLRSFKIPLLIIGNILTILVK